MRLVTHSYDTYDQAVRAVEALEKAGVPHDDISLVSGDKDRTVATTVAGDTTGAGTGASLGTVLGGGAGLLAGLGMLAIPGVGPVVAAGWLVATLAGAGVGAAAGGLLGSLTNAGVEEGQAQHYVDHIGRGGTLLTVRASDEIASKVEQILEHGELPVAPSAQSASVPLAAPVASPTAAAPVAGNRGVADDIIQVVREDLVVGKRKVESGDVRVTSRVVETPVEQQVHLQEERVTVERRPVNRPLTGEAAQAFTGRVIEAHTTTEQPVVTKEARVIEEVVLHKETTDRVETVRDTVRETKVDVEQEPARATVPGTAHPTSATTGEASNLRDNSATRALDNTLGTNVSGERPDQADGTPANPPGTMASRAVDKTLGTNVSGANPTGKL